MCKSKIPNIAKEIWEVKKEKGEDREGDSSNQILCLQNPGNKNNMGLLQKQIDQWNRIYSMRHKEKREREKRDKFGI